MKFNTSSFTLLTLASIATISSAARCTSTYAFFFLTYTISADGVPDVDKTYHSVLGNLHRFGSCATTGPNHKPQSEGFSMVFNVPIGCNKGMVESAWWEATKNEYGSIKC
jgi:hypothetical protein